MQKLIENQKPVSKGAIEKVVASEASKSSKMKALFDLGMPVKEIAAVLQVRYNFVYNVVSNYIIQNDIPTVTNKKPAKKEQIVAMHKEGATVKQIAIELKVNTNYVYNTLKALKEQTASN